MGYILARIHELKAELAAMPEVDPATREVTKLEAIRQLEPEIVGLRTKGYRLDGVITLLAARGVPITVGTLRTYLRRLDKQRQANHASSAAPTAAEQPENTPATPKTRVRKPEEPVGAPAADAGANNGSGPATAATTPQQSPRKRQRQRVAGTAQPPPQPRDQPPATPESPETSAVGTGGPSAERPPAPAEHSVSAVVEPEPAAVAPGPTGAPAPPERPSSTRGMPAVPAVTSTKASFAPREDSEEI